MSSNIEIIPSILQSDRLYWTSGLMPPRKRENSCFICIDNDLIYQPFSQDFGPLNLGMTYRFCFQLNALLSDSRYKTFQIYHYCSKIPDKRANAAFLMGAFQIIILKRTAREAWEKFSSEPFAAFRDASSGPCYYDCLIPHCLAGLEKGIYLGWFNFNTFNVQEYEFNEQVEHGDFNWIIPNKMMAFSCPSAKSYDEDGWRCFTPEDYAPIFKKLGVTAVVRLNQKTYEASRFKKFGINHYDLYFIDGTVPSEAIVKKFLSIARKEKGAIAIHCKAGLGRTGTLIGCYAIKYHMFKATEFIGWCRICRPGSVLGPQQQFLLDYEQNYSRVSKRRSCMEMSPNDKRKAKFGDKGQAERLLSAKKYRQTPDRKEKRPSSVRNAVRRALTMTPARTREADIDSLRCSQCNQVQAQC